ncbi:NAD(P)-binding domain-containing protein [Streptomyces sp. NPDC088725]|uniref:NAD(P)-binding domain-containing protein n=1 Tax=Streptomyces sp. NPDC088725 TaxID=3365873 RepID=UPI003812F5D3
MTSGTRQDTADRELRAGVVGLGMIGGGVAVSLARSGRAPAVHDIRPDAAEGLDGVPDVLASPAEVARAADVVMVAVVNAEQARAAITGDDGLLTAAHPGLTVVLLSTVALPVVHELAAACTEAGAGFLDCGVTPGDKAAEHGMVAILGGDSATVEYATPVLADWAKQVVHCGPSGAGMATKIARNVITYGSWRTAAEAAALARAAGVDPATLTTVIDAADPGGTTLLQLLRMQGDGSLTDALRQQIDTLMTKDLDAALDLAAALGVDAPLVGVARERAADTLGGGSEDTSPSGSPLPNLPPLPSDQRERGLEMMDRVYGPGLKASAGTADTPFLAQTVDHLFADVWSRPDLSVRDRRLLTLGVAASAGRADLIRIQAGGALTNGEFTPAQLNEAVLHLAHYVGWCNATATHQGITEALADHARAHDASPEEL